MVAAKLSKSDASSSSKLTMVKRRSQIAVGTQVKCVVVKKRPMVERMVLMEELNFFH